jgi:ankyrin repeat protein
MVIKRSARLLATLAVLGWWCSCTAAPKSDSSPTPATASNAGQSGNAQAYTGPGAFWEAIVNGDLAYVQAHPDLANRRIMMMDGSSTPLDQAIIKGKIDIAKLLLEQKADPNLLDDNWISPLKLAIHAGEVDLVSLLLKAGANTDTDVHATSPDPVLGRKTPQEVAEALHDPEPRQQILDLLAASAKK